MFHSARLKLTTWYLVIIMLISLFFSAVIYTMLTREVERFAHKQRYLIERGMGRGYIARPVDPLDPDLVEETRERIFLMLANINGFIFVASGVLGYILAGRTLKPIQEMVDEQHRFITDASHELRTPLTSLKSALEVSLRDPKFNVKDAKFLVSESIEEVNKLQTLAEGLLQLAQYETKNRNSFEKGAVSKIITDAVRKIQSKAKQKGIVIKTEIPDISIHGNILSLTDLMVILLDNAVKYSAKGDTIKIETRKTDGHIGITVADTGIGIDEKDIPHIFDRFYRADTARSKTERDGYGLGLSIAKKIVDMHRGSIKVTSTPGTGTIFTIKLPRV